jgi:hypothetical protein
MTKMKPTVRWEKYISVSNGSYLDYLSKYGQTFLQKITNNLIAAHKSQKPNVVLFTFKDSVITCTATFSEYETILNKMINLCEKLEYYEICAQILRHLNTFHERTKKLHELKLN